MEKLRYEVDPHNRLVVKNRKIELSKFRRVLDGQFKAGNNNQLSYHIKSSISKDKKAPHQVKFKGKWSLTKNHDLRFTLDKWKRQSFGDQLTLEGDIIDVDNNFLLFAVGTRTAKGSQSIYLLKLEGKWQADKNNRLTLRVNKGKDRYDSLTFDGVWQIGRDYQLIYQYQKKRLARGERKIHTLIFKGQWQINDKKRISYVIDKDNDSEFNFNSALGKFRSNYMKYEVGIGISRRKKPARQTITLLGSWKIKKNLGLIFEVEYGKKNVQTIIFGAEAKLVGSDTVLFKLKNIINRDINAELELKHKIISGDGDAFLRILKSSSESAILVGAGRGW